MEDYIDITTTDGKIKKAEVVFRVRDENKNNYYIVYKFADEYFAAKYDDVKGISNLDTDLSNKELDFLENMLNDVMEVKE